MAITYLRPITDVNTDLSITPSLGQAHYTVVDEEASDRSDYLSGVLLAVALDSFKFDAASKIPANAVIQQVEVCADVYADGGGDLGSFAQFEIYNDAVQFILNSDYLVHDGLVTFDVTNIGPSDGKWTRSDLAGYNFGMRLANDGYYDNGFVISDTADCYQLYIKVTYTAEETAVGQIIIINE